MLRDRAGTALRRARASAWGRAVGVAALATLAVRSLGLVSQALAASKFGASAELDAFFLAFILPGLIAVPLAATAELSVGPIYARLLRHEPDAAAPFRRAVLGRALLVGAALAVVAAAAAPVLIELSAPGASAVTHRLAEPVARLMYLTMAPLVVSGAAASLLYGADRVQLPVLVQVVRPVALIGVLLVGSPSSAVPLAAASLAAAVVEAVVLVALATMGHRRSAGREATADGHLSEAWGSFRGILFVTFAVQAGPAIDLAFVAGLGTGRVVIYSIAVRFYDVVKGLFIQPSNRLAQNRLGQSVDRSTLASRAKQEQRRAVRVGVLSALLLAVLGPLAVIVFYVNGEFSASAGWRTIAVLEIFAVALVPFAVSTLNPRILIALGRRRAATGLLAAYTVTNVVLDAVLLGPLGLYGIACASLTALVLSVAIAWRIIGRAVASAASAPPGRVPALEDEQ